jgi:hypothetical protein
MPSPFPPKHWSRYLTVLGGLVVVLGIWVSLFAVGILVDSKPYRQVISPEGASALQSADPSSEPGNVGAWHIQKDSVLLRLDDSLSPSSDTVRMSSAPSVPLDDRRPDSITAFLVENTKPSTDSTLWATLVTRPKAPTDSSFVAFLVVLFCFTPTNLALVCCFAGVLGAMGRRVVLAAERDRGPHDHTFPFLSAVLRGFFVYLAVISGILVLLENPILGTASPGQYIRFAGLLSLTSFFVNYDPTMFVSLLNRVRDQMQQDPENDEDDVSTAPNDT